MAAAVMGNDASAAFAEEHHLRVPGIGRQGPAMREDDRLPLAPILVKDPGTVVCGDRGHVRIPSSAKAAWHPRE